MNKKEDRGIGSSLEFYPICSSSAALKPSRHAGGGVKSTLDDQRYLSGEKLAKPGRPSEWPFV